MQLGCIAVQAYAFCLIAFQREILVNNTVSLEF